MNVVCLVGRLTADPELRQTPNGINVCSFSIAVQSSTKNPDGTYKADFINCVAWRTSAEFITRYFRKGQNIGINGSIQTRQYQDKDTGKNRTAFEVIVNNTYFVESKNSANNSGGYNSYNTPSYNNPVQPAKQQDPAAFVSGDLGEFSSIASADGDLPF